MENKTRIEVSINNRNLDIDRTEHIDYLLAQLEELQNLISSNYRVSIFTTVAFPEFDYDPFQESLDSYELKKDDNVRILCNKYSYIGTDKFQCPICMLDFEEKDTVGELECNHSFHFRCIKEWGKYKQECPLCRHAIKTENKN